MHNESISTEKQYCQSDSVKNQIDAVVLELIKERKKKKITQVELAEMTGVPQSTISRVESLSSIPTLPVVIKISNALGISWIPTAMQ